MEKCNHSNLNFQYHNRANNKVNHCTECKILIITKPNDNQLYTLDKNLQLIPIQ